MILTTPVSRLFRTALARARASHSGSHPAGGLSLIRAEKGAAPGGRINPRRCSGPLGLDGRRERQTRSDPTRLRSAKRQQWPGRPLAPPPREPPCATRPPVNLFAALSFALARDPLAPLGLIGPGGGKPPAPVRAGSAGDAGSAGSRVSGGTIRAGLAGRARSLHRYRCRPIWQAGCRHCEGRREPDGQHLKSRFRYSACGTMIIAQVFGRPVE